MAKLPLKRLACVYVHTFSNGDTYVGQTLQKGDRDESFEGRNTRYQEALKLCGNPTVAYSDFFEYTHAIEIKDAVCECERETYFKLHASGAKMLNKVIPAKSTGARRSCQYNFDTDLALKA